MTTFYVSTEGKNEWSGLLPEPNAEKTDGPFATIIGARNKIRHLVQMPGYCNDFWQPKGIDGPISVLIRGGVYPLQETIDFAPDDTAPVTYAAYPNETPILDGGVRITGWREEIVNGKQCWVTDLPEVALGSWYFRSLFVNGERRARPRLPKTDWFWIEDVPGRTLDSEFQEGSDKFISKPGDIQNWRNITDAEVVALHFWNDEHMPIASFDEGTRLVTCTRKSIFTLKDDVHPRFAKYYVQNVFEALTEPGEWYLYRPTGRLYYIPMEGESPENTEVYAPRLTRLMEIVGDPDQGRLVQNLRFEGLTFRHTDVVLPPGGWDPSASNPGEGVRGWSKDIDYASAPQAAFNVPGAILFEGARACAIEDCRIEHIGWCGVEIGDGCGGVRIVGNEMSDLGAGGVAISGSDSYSPRSRRTGYNVITDNHIHHGGRIFHQAVGILLRHTFGNVVAHNHIHDLYYSGISCGWIWGMMETVCRDNRIEKNHIHHLGFGWLSDMGGIYMLGVQPGTVLRGNLIHDVEKANYGGWGIYLDEGSSHMVVENNITYGTSTEGFMLHFGRENIVRNNIFAAGRSGNVMFARAADGIHPLTFERNIVMSEGSSLFVNGYGHSLRTPKFTSDYNLLWCTTGELKFGAGEHVSEDSPTLEEIQAAGMDRHSIIADPKFKDFAGRDFTLADDSPAFELGFKPIDMSDVGPRPKDNRG